MKKFISILLVAMLILGMFPATTLTAFAAGETYEKATSIAVGDTVVLVYETGTKELDTTFTNTGSKMHNAGVSYSGTAPAGVAPLIVESGATSGTFAFKMADGKYLNWSSGNSLSTATSISANSSWKVTFSNGDAKILNANDSSRSLQWNASSPRFACYTSAQKAVQLYKLSGGTTPDPEPGCTTHENAYLLEETAVAATCTTAGKEADLYCPDCDKVVQTGATIDALDHNYVDGVCTNGCGIPEPEAPVIPESGNYKLITALGDVLAGGQYVFVVEYKGNYYALGNTIDSKIAPVETIVSGEYVEGSAPSWEVGSYDGGVTLFNGTKYLGHSSGANFASSADPFKWTVQDNGDGTFLLISSGDAERAVAYNYNSGSHRFGPYDVENLNNAQYALRLRIYKLTEGGEVEFNGKLNFVENGKVTTVTPAYGSSYALPEATVTVPTGYTFAGWVEATLSETTVTPETIHEVGATITVPASKTYYALYTRSETTQGGGTVEVFQKVTAAPASWVGTYLIVYETGKVAFNGSLNSLDAASNTVGVTITTDKQITTDIDNLKTKTFTIDADGNIKSASGYYIGHTGSSNGLKSSTSTKYAHTLRIDESGNAVLTATTNYILRYNNSSAQYRFRYYKSGQQAIQLYVLTEVASGGSTTTTYYTTVVEDSCAHGSYVSVSATTVACAYCGTEKAAAASIGNTGYATVEAAINAMGEMQTVKLQAPVDSISYAGDLYLDLNGYSVGSVVLAGDLHAFDSKATTSAASGAKIAETNVNYIEKDFTADGKRYIALQEGECGYSFHVLEMKLSAVSLRTTAAGIYYKATVVCDDELAAAADTYGIALSTRNMPGADFATENEVNGWTEVKNVGETALTSGKAFTSGSVFGIFKEGLTNNAARGGVKIYANAYIKVGSTVIMADKTVNDEATDEGFNGVAWSLKDVMVKLNETFGDLSEAQQTQIAKFYKEWTDAMSTWELTKIAQAAAELPAA